MKTWTSLLRQVCIVICIIILLYLGHRRVHETRRAWFRENLNKYRNVLFLVTLESRRLFTFEMLCTFSNVNYCLRAFLRGSVVPFEGPLLRLVSRGTPARNPSFLLGILLRRPFFRRDTEKTVSSTPRRLGRLDLASVVRPSTTGKLFFVFFFFWKRYIH